MSFDEIFAYFAMSFDFLEFFNYSHPESSNAKKKNEDLKTADDALREIDEDFLKLDADKIENSNQILNWLELDVVNAMKEIDQLFNVLFREIYSTGSYFDDLKIREPDEFDLNFVLDLSLFKVSLTVFACDVLARFWQEVNSSICIVFMKYLDIM